MFSISSFFFPSWMSRVRAPSPAPFFNDFSHITRSVVLALYRAITSYFYFNHENFSYIKNFGLTYARLKPRTKRKHIRHPPKNGRWNRNCHVYSTKKTEAPKEGIRLLIIRLGCYQCRYLHFYEKSSYNFRVWQPFVIRYVIYHLRFVYLKPLTNP